MQNIKRAIAIFSLVLLFSGFTKAQDPRLLIYYASGTVGKSGSKAILKKGAMLASNEILYLADNSSVLIICSDFTVFKVSGKGRYPVKELEKKCKKDPQSFSSSYFKYVWHEFTQKHGTPDHNPLSYMQNIGAVVRGYSAIEQKFSIDTINYFKGTLPLVFDSLPIPVIAAVFTDEYDGGLLNSKVFTQAKVNLESIFNTLPVGTYYWQLLDSTKALTLRKVVNILPEADYLKQVNAITYVVPKSSAAETAFLKAYLLTEKGFLSAAYGFYKEAMKLSPANKEYQKSFKSLFF